MPASQQSASTPCGIRMESQPLRAGVPLPTSGPARNRKSWLAGCAYLLTTRTSCTFIIRSISVAEYVWPGFTIQPDALHPVLSKRTNHLLIRPDRSHVNDTQNIYCLTPNAPKLSMFRKRKYGRYHAVAAEMA
jgi:hypothetical protein